MTPILSSAPRQSTDYRFRCHWAVSITPCNFAVRRSQLFSSQHGGVRLKLCRMTCKLCFVPWFSRNVLGCSILHTARSTVTETRITPTRRHGQSQGTRPRGSAAQTERWERVLSRSDVAIELEADLIYPSCSQMSR